MKNISTLLLFTALIACEGDVGPSGLTSLIKVDVEPTGSNCAFGGHRIGVGVDANKNGILDDNEIQSTQYICNGSNGTNGQNSLVKMTVEAAGTNCSFGGQKLQTGFDSNSNGILNDGEIQSTQYICNGSNGQNGLVKMTPETPGSNCTFGGYKMQTGLDSNINGTLDNNEVQSTQYVCNGDGEGASHVILDFNIASNVTWSTSTSMILSERNGIPEFNIQNFPGVDSVAFGAYLESSDIATNCLLELYDETNNVAIANSGISTNSTPNVWVTTSVNLVDKFASGPIDLRLRLTSTNGAPVSFSVPKLILVWK
jgi:hypothetical protein